MAISESEFLNKTKRIAQNYAELKNLIFRLIRVDGEPFLPYPDDIRTDRVCVEIDNGVISKVTFQ